MFYPEQYTREGIVFIMYKTFQPDSHYNNVKIKCRSWGGDRIITGEHLNAHYHTSLCF